MSSALNKLNASEIAAAVNAGRITAVSVVEDCLDRIEAREPIVQAWEFIDREQAIEQARQVDKDSKKGTLAGVPVGIKDIIDTRDMPTGMGSSIYEGYKPKTDAACVTRLQSAGAIVIGKTVTCEFAGVTPGKTTNPYDPSRTPGGSSSGSCAAVADYMVPIALGTQTGGSVIRPSSYCGIIGYKPSFDSFSLKGVFPAAESLDTLGVHARSIEDVELVAAALVNRPPKTIQVLKRPPVIGVCRTWMWDEAKQESRDAIETASAGMKAAGAFLRDIELPEEFQWLADVRHIINARERADIMATHWINDRPKLSAQSVNTIQSGLDITHDDYLDAMYLMDTCRARMNHTFDSCDFILTPSVDGEAPRGLKDTGDHKFQSLWTMLQVPTVTLPTHKGPNELPVGIQIIAPYRKDDALMAAAQWVLKALNI